jgi:hypothetical protein
MVNTFVTLAHGGNVVIGNLLHYFDPGKTHLCPAQY